MEAPEKIYLDPALDALTKALSEKTEDDVEYIRTDAFIEKACEWLSKHFYDDVYEIRDDEGTFIDADLLIEDFENYMKEN